MRRANRSLHTAQQLVSLRIAEFQQFSSVQRMIRGIGNQLVVLDVFSNFKGHDPVVTSCKPPVQVITPRGQILASRTGDSWR